MRHTAAAISALITTGLALLTQTPPAHAATTAFAYPGMTIIQGHSKCTLAYIDTAQRIGYSAGHCDASPTVSDEDGNPIGTVTDSQDNHAGITFTHNSDVVIDYETISINPTVNITNMLGPALTRPIVTEQGITPQAGMHVCHRGAATPCSCGDIDQVYDGWFTMKTDTMTSEHGDSGGPVYTYTAAGGDKPVIVGILRGLHANKVAAVSWPDTLRYASKPK